MVIRNFKYTAEDVDCQYCTEFRHRRCSATKCPYLRERIEAGAISYQQAVSEAFDKRSPLRPRVQLVTGFGSKSFWKNEAHRRRSEYMDTVPGYYRRRNTDAYYAVLYLISSDEELAARMSNCFHKKQINFANAKLGDISPEGYALYKVAKGLYSDSAEVGVDELADPELVNVELFRLVVNAMLICRYGLSALQLKSEGDAYGSLSG